MISHQGGDEPVSRRFSTAVPFGEGGTASLYTAHDLALGRLVVLKVPHRSSAEQVERTFREARALAAIRHPGVCQVYAVGFDDGRPFIALEKVEGRTLTDFHVELGRAERVALVARIADAIQAIHEAGVIHRDVKPDNVMVRIAPDGRPQPVVIDFGLVQFGASSTRVTQAGTPLGTPGFMAPEQVRGDPEQIDERSDVYALGATLYFVLTGRPVFEGSTAAEVMLRSLHEEAPTPRRHVADLDPALEAITLQCLETDPARRYPTARALADDLRRYLEHDEVSARRMGPLERSLRRFARQRTRVWAVALTACVGLALALLVLAELQHHRDRRAEFQRWADDLEWRLRAEYMAPQHDISVRERTVRAQADALALQLPALDRAARANAHFALGRVRAALGDDRTAEQHLRSAWDGGRDDADVAYLLGLVLSRRYAAGMKRAARSLDAALREQRIATLARELRDPARSFLDRARGTQLPVPPEYPHILIAAHERRFDAALAMLGALRQRTPWFFEAWIAEGHLLQVRGLSAYGDGDLHTTLALFERAHGAYRAARAVGQSHPAVHERLCVTAADVIGLRQELGAVVGSAEVEAMLRVCGEALTVAPEHPLTLASAAWANEFAARQASIGGDMARTLRLADLAVEQAARAVQHAPDDPTTVSIHATALLTSLAVPRTADATHLDAALGEAVAVLDNLLNDEPGSTDRLVLFRSRVELEVARGNRLQPPGPGLAKALDLGTRLAQLPARSFSVPLEVGVGLSRLARVLDLSGQPTAQIDDLVVALTDQARRSNPHMADTWRAAASARYVRGLTHCATDLQAHAPDFAAARDNLRGLGTVAPAEAMVYRLWGRLFETSCALLQERRIAPLAPQVRRWAQEAAARLGPTTELAFWLHMAEWRALLTDPVPARSALRDALNAPLDLGGAPTPLADLWKLQVPLTKADLALQLGEDPLPLLERAGADVERLARLAPTGVGTPIGLLRTRAVLEFLRVRAQPGVPDERLREAAQQVLALPLSGTRADIPWRYWRQRVARLSDPATGPVAQPSARTDASRPSTWMRR